MSPRTPQRDKAKTPKSGRHNKPALPGVKTAKQLRAVLLRRGAILMKRLEAQSGPAFSHVEVATRLGVSASKVKQMERRGKLIGFPRAGARCYPAWQFDGPMVRLWVAPLIRLAGGARPALHALMVRRETPGVTGTYQLLAHVLANDTARLSALLCRMQGADELTASSARKPTADDIPVMKSNAPFACLER